MKMKNYILLVLIVEIFVTIGRIDGRAIPDFYTDEDLKAWHKFGLRSFYGPWGVIARKPNGDLISYVDYGSTIPSDFLPISTSEDDDPPHKRDTNPSGLELFATGVGSYESSSSIDVSHDLGQNDHSDTNEESSENLNLANLDKHHKRDTLELIGIVGVIENDGTSDTDDIIAKIIDPLNNDGESIASDSTNVPS